MPDRNQSRPDRTLYPLDELVTGRATFGLPFRELSLTLTGREVAVFRAAWNGHGQGDVVSGLDGFLSIETDLVQTLLWQPYAVQPTPENARDRSLREHGGLFRHGWLSLLVDLAPGDATFSLAGLATWLLAAEAALARPHDENLVQTMLTKLARELNGRVDPDDVLAGWLAGGCVDDHNEDPEPEEAEKDLLWPDEEGPARASDATSVTEDAESNTEAQDPAEDTDGGDNKRPQEPDPDDLNAAVWRGPEPDVDPASES